ncbi:MAG: Nif3-like dinuclear metal center hexameric protein [Candidatus Latescibacteria bacterium]|jgi:putative NIF3 family GTP cyclohydrolase 1 type 2|nr:Nif3-like dinuclear metal center hexameric protein [Candidatus Latescibacterota bacterium]
MATARDIDEFVRDLDPDIRSEKSCDGLKYGDLDAEVRAIGTTWMASVDVLRRAVEKDINLIVTHEPTFWYSGTPASPELERCEREGVYVGTKVRYLDEHGITIIRAHDCWDLYPEYGVEPSLCKVLGFPAPARYLGGLHSVYNIPTTTLGDLARHCKTAMGLPHVRVSGDLRKTVRRIAIAYGSSSSTKWYWDFSRAGADAVLSGEQSEWSTVRPAIDMGLGVIELGHAATEAYGMDGMARLLEESFPGILIQHLRTDPSFQWV